MYQNYYPTQSRQFFGLKGHPVSSLEEVKATGIDFDGSVFFFPDIANKCIYTKQINLDGTASLNMYELKELPKQIPPAEYITRQEFENTLTELKKILNPKEETDYKF